MNGSEAALRINVLADNNAGTLYRAEHGLSFLIEASGKKILFDSGQSDLFIKNAGSMDLNLADCDIMIMSHGHFDHGNGFRFLKSGKLLCHPGCFSGRYRKKDHTYIGLSGNREVYTGKFDLICSSGPYLISDRIWYLGAIPRMTEFESRTTDFIFRDGSEDFVDDDSALAVILDTGLFVITGCGHAGIVNTLEHARKVTGISRISGIMGGFHLKEQNRQLDETISYLLEAGVRHVIPCHCTQFPAMCAFYENFFNSPVRTGDRLQIN